MIEKKLILCGILAIAIGIATIVPLEYMMAAQAQENSNANSTAQINAEIPKVEPMFSDVNITYAYCDANKIVGNDTSTLYGAGIEAVVNFTLNPDALNGADAQIEYYKFAVSSDQGPIINMGYYIVLASNQNIVTGIGGPNGTVNFASGLNFNGPTLGQNINYGSGGQDINLDVWSPNYAMGYVSNNIFGTDSNNLPQAATELRNAQTLYIDVSKLCTVTVNGNVTVTTPASNQILQHIELTNLGSGVGFMYGSYVQGTMPLPIDMPTLPSQSGSSSIP
jgi:hypothetical protein